MRVIATVALSLEAHAYILPSAPAAAASRSGAADMMSASAVAEDPIAVLDPPSDGAKSSLAAWRDSSAVSSWYDAGVRLGTSASAASAVASEDVTSWYDSGVRLVASDPPVVVEEAAEKVSETVPKPKLTASAEASFAAALISGLAVVGIDMASLGVVENLDAAVVVGGLALSQVDEEGPIGDTLRAVGNTTTFVAKEVVVPTVTATAKFAEEKELGLNARALLELGIESAIYALDPERKVREQAEREAAEAAARAAAEAAERRAKKDALPWWDPSKYGP
mmetsp:Transcript_32483/g.85269  ORF Transcript_32483/g.85269 Transcript_32483/m.85269 type:complete len:280 (-) Transcript_32483:691-1530(-)